jgi:hypothetical protein
VWNSTTTSELNPGINSARPSVGVAPLLCDLERQEYLEERQAQAEVDRCLAVLAGWTTMSPWCVLT